MLIVHFIKREYTNCLFNIPLFIDEEVLLIMHKQVKKKTKKIDHINYSVSQ